MNSNQDSKPSFVTVTRTRQDPLFRKSVLAKDKKDDSNLLYQTKTGKLKIRTQFAQEKRVNAPDLQKLQGAAAIRNHPAITKRRTTKKLDTLSELLESETSHQSPRSSESELENIGFKQPSQKSKESGVSDSRRQRSSSVERHSGIATPTRHASDKSEIALRINSILNNPSANLTISGKKHQSPAKSSIRSSYFKQQLQKDNPRCYDDLSEEESQSDIPELTDFNLIPVKQNLNRNAAKTPTSPLLQPYSSSTLQTVQGDQLDGFQTNSELLKPQSSNRREEFDSSQSMNVNSFKIEEAASFQSQQQSESSKSQIKSTWTFKCCCCVFSKHKKQEVSEVSSVTSQSVRNRSVELPQDDDFESDLSSARPLFDESPSVNVTPKSSLKKQGTFGGRKSVAFGSKSTLMSHRKSNTLTPSDFPKRSSTVAMQDDATSFKSKKLSKTQHLGSNISRTQTKSLGQRLGDFKKQGSSLFRSMRSKLSSTAVRMTTQGTKPFNQMTPEEKKERIKSHWRKIRFVARSTLFIQRMQQQNQQNEDAWNAQLFGFSTEHDEQEEPTAWYLLKPDSNLSKIWANVISWALYFNMICTPTIMLWPHFYEESVMLQATVWVNEALWLIDMLLSFIKINEKYVTKDPFEIGLRYFKGLFFVDLVILIPQIVSLNNKKFWFLKIIRILHASYLKVPIEFFLSIVFANQLHRKRDLLYIASYLINMMILTHGFVCVWIWMGDKDFHPFDRKQPWRLANSDFDGYSEYQLYVFAYYWIFTAISTVGYGDYAGGTRVEYLFSILLEFVGLCFFSLLMFAVSKVFDTKYNFDKYIEEKFQQLDIWITTIEKSNKPYRITPDLFIGMRQSLEDAFLYDFNTIIEEHDFYQKLTPRMQTELVYTLFGDFIDDFDHFFSNCNQGFINEVVLNMYARTYEAGKDIIIPGQHFDEMYFIIKGRIVVCEPSSYKEPFLILPTHSFFGDYQVLLGTPSVFYWRAVNEDEMDLYEDEPEETGSNSSRIRRGSFLSINSTRSSAKKKVPTPKLDPHYFVMNNVYRMKQEDQTTSKKLASVDERIVVMCVKQDVFLEACNTWPGTAVLIEELAIKRRAMLMKQRDKKQHLSTGPRKDVPLIGISQRRAHKFSQLRSNEWEQLENHELIKYEKELQEGEAEKGLQQMTKKLDKVISLIKDVRKLAISNPDLRNADLFKQLLKIKDTNIDLSDHESENGPSDKSSNEQSSSCCTDSDDSSSHPATHKAGDSDQLVTKVREAIEEDKRRKSAKPKFISIGRFSQEQSLMPRSTTSNLIQIGEHSDEESKAGAQVQVGSNDESGPIVHQKTSASIYELVQEVMMRQKTLKQSRESLRSLKQPNQKITSNSIEALEKEILGESAQQQSNVRVSAELQDQLQKRGTLNDKESKSNGADEMLPNLEVKQQHTLQIDKSYPSRSKMQQSTDSMLSYNKMLLNISNPHSACASQADRMSVRSDQSANRSLSNETVCQRSVPHNLVERGSMKQLSKHQSLKEQVIMPVLESKSRNQNLHQQATRGSGNATGIFDSLERKTTPLVENKLYTSDSETGSPSSPMKIKSSQFKSNSEQLAAYQPSEPVRSEEVKLPEPEISSYLSDSISIGRVSYNTKKSKND